LPDESREVRRRKLEAEDGADLKLNFTYGKQVEEMELANKARL
jgi:hypothetical protein